MKKRILFLFLLQFLTVIGASAQQAVKVPDGKSFLIDGKCETEEWKDAAELTTPADYKFSFKKTNHYVFICIASQQASNFMVDLYLSAADGKLYTLHASAKLGERTLEGDKWREWRADWNWWDIDNWWANTLRPDSFEKRTFLPHKAIEFQISRKRFGGKQWRVMFDIISSGSFLFPGNADKLKKDKWLMLKLDK